MNAFTIYLIEISGAVGSSLGILSLLGLCASGALAICLIFSDDMEEESRILTIKKTKKFFLISLMCAFLSCLIPDSKTLVSMYVIPPIANNVEMQKLPANILKFVNEYLEKEGK